MKNLTDSLLIFNKLSNDLGNSTIALLKGEAYNSEKSFRLGPDQAVVNCLMDMIIINSCSFIDEYDKHFGVTTEEIFEERILSIKKVCKPVFKQINRWKDLRTIRNSFLAHNLRFKDRTMIFRKEMNHNAPRGIYEIEFLNNLIQVVFKVVTLEFKKELDAAISSFELQISDFNQRTKDEHWAIIDQLIVDINRQLHELNRKYSI